MATSTTSTVYINVIEDVINKVREEFVNNGGPGESVLNELQGLWEMKMIQTGAVLGPIERSSAPKTAPGAAITPVHDLNVPYEGTEEYETPTAEMLFPPTPLPGTVDSLMYNIPTGSTDYPTPISNEGASGPPDMKPGIGRPSPYMQPPSPWMNQRPSLGVDVNVAYVDGREDPDRGASRSSNQEFLTGPPGKRKRDDLVPQYQEGNFIPQQDGAGDVVPDVFELEIIQSKSRGRSDTLKITNGKVASVSQIVSRRIPQLDGPTPDPYDDMLSTPKIYNYQGVTNEDYNLVNTPAPDLQAGTPVVPHPNDIPEEDGDDEPPLNENDDDELDDLDQGEELNTQHLVLAQFDKVTRTKSRWKCTLKDGIMHINNKDILFNKVTGEFDF